MEVLGRAGEVERTADSMVKGEGGRSVEEEVLLVC